MNSDCQGGETPPPLHKWKQGTPRGLLDQIVVLSHFIGEGFVGVYVTERKEMYTALHFWADCVLPGGAARCAATWWKTRHAFSLLLPQLLVNHPDNNQERFMELITKIQSWVLFEVKSPKQWNWREETKNLRITFLLGSKQMQTFSGYSPRKYVNYTKYST